MYMYICVRSFQYAIFCCDNSDNNKLDNNNTNINYLSSELWPSQSWTQFKQLRIEAWKSQDFNGVWTFDFVIPVPRSNQLSYEATNVGSWWFVSSNEPAKNGCEV